MFQRRIESIIAIIGIAVIGLLSLMGILDANVGKVIALVIFAMSEVMTCLHMKKRNEDWKREAAYGTFMLLLVFVLLGL